MGHLEEVYYLGAVAVGSMVFNMLYWGFGFLRMGTTGLTAQSYGSGNAEDTATQLGRSLLVSLALGVLLVLLQSVIFELGLRLVETSAQVEKHARIYLSIRIYAAPATLALFVLHGWFLGMQNARFPLYLSLTANFANIGLNLLFLRVFDMKADGIAWGTLLAQYMSLGLGFLLLWFFYKTQLKQLSWKRIVDWLGMKRLFSVNRDIFLRTMALVFTFTFFTAQSAKFGDQILAINTVLQQFWLITAYGIDGFSHAAESLTGKYLGASQKDKVRSVIRTSFTWGMGVAFCLSIVFVVFGETLVSLFTNKPELVALAMQYFAWTCLVPLTSCVAFLWDGVFLGATETKHLRNTMFFAAFVIFLPAFYATRQPLGNHGLWLAMTAFMLTRGIILSIQSRKLFFQ